MLRQASTLHRRLHRPRIATTAARLRQHRPGYQARPRVRVLPSTQGYTNIKIVVFIAANYLHQQHRRRIASHRRHRIAHGLRQRQRVLLRLRSANALLTRF